MSTFELAPPIRNPFNISPVGFAPIPTFVDINGDGDLDLFTGNKRFSGRIEYLENIGSRTNPAFAASVNNPFGIAPSGRYTVPTFADIDNDGDKDLFVGRDFNIDFFGNSGTASTPIFAPPIRNPFGITGSGRAFNAPSFADIDGDGDLDFFNGQDGRRLQFFQNTGSASSPSFSTFDTSSTLNLDTQFDGIRTPIPAFADADGDRDLDLFVGDKTGSLNLSFYENTGTRTSPSFGPRQVNPFGFTPSGARYLFPTFADLDGDGDQDLLTGSDRSSIFFYQNIAAAPITADTTSPSLSSSTPADNAKGVAIDVNIILNFSENVVAGNGDILIKRLSDNATFASIAISDPQVSISGSTVIIDPTSSLATSTAYYLEIASGVIQDSAGNAYLGINDPTALNFTTIARSRFPFIPGGSEPVTPADQAPGATDLQPLDLDADGFRENKQARDGLLVDANRDGTADFLQTEVIAIRLLNDGASASDYGALLPAPGIKVSGISFTAPSPGGTIPVTTRSGATINAAIPTDITNALSGALSFDLSGVAPGGTTQLTLAVPAGLQPTTSNAYLRFNYATNRFEDYLDSQGNRLYSFLDTDRDGNFDAINLTLIDGDPAWDRDGKANGTIVDPGFPATGERNLVGTNRKDSLIGNALANTINGKNNDDVLMGDLGPDLLIGAAGKDRYLYTRADESTPAQRDTVQLDPDDRFLFSSFDGDITTEGLQTLRFIGKQAFSGVAGELRATRSLLEADVNGDALADFAVNLRGSGPINSNSIVL